MLGILCEKPSAARNFAKALGGISGTYNGEAYVIANSVGHLYEYDNPDKQVPSDLSEKYRVWDLANLPWDDSIFAWHRVQKPKTSDVTKQIRAAFKDCDEIAIATDVDPTGEGELLAWEILDELGFEPKKWSRFYFLDESPSSIQKAFKTRKPIPSMMGDPDFQKAYYRSKFDFLTMQFTRIAKQLTGTMLRQGRLKSYMIVLVGDALDAVAKYKKVPYYQWRFKDENGNVFSDSNEAKHPTKEEMSQIYSDSGIVVDSTTQESTPPPKLLDLAALSSMLASKGIKAKQVLDVYQKMYEDQVVSYPRTEDKFITPEQFNELLPFVDKIASVVGVDTKLLTHRTPRATHVKTGGAHGANRPGVNVPNSLADLNKYGAIAADIYTILAKNYLAMLCEDYLYTHQTGHLEKYPSFTGSANQPVSMGYKAVFNDSDDETDDTGKLLGKLANPFVYEGFPPKPPLPTMKLLMKQLEKRDVGTGATRTSIYAEVTNDNNPDALMKEAKGKLSLTDKGRMSYLILSGTCIGSADLTEQMQQNMRDIADGKVKPEVCLAKVKDMVIHDIETMTNNLPRVKSEFTITQTPIVSKDKYTGIYKPSKKEVTFNRQWGGVYFTDEQCEDLLDGKEISFQAVSSKTGNPYTAKGKLKQQTYNGHKFWGFAPDFK